jgi:hypothetical protein
MPSADSFTMPASNPIDVIIEADLSAINKAR